ncbi:MAG: hypothetical protein EB121_08015, partial [Alphaproteobacteria bacterium]|nr:hypothetical protein [Alphaproteobacteria bacterium]
ITQKVGLREKFHHIMINPPFYMTQKNMPKKNASKKISNHMAEEDIALWVMAAKKLLRAKGYVTMIVPVSVSMLWIRHLAQCFGDIRLLPLWPHAGEAAKRVLLRARVGGMGPSVLLPGLVLHEADGRYTVGAQKILGEGAPIFESEADDA